MSTEATINSLKDALADQADVRFARALLAAK